MVSKYRVRKMGTRHATAAGHYLAAQAAFQILEAGGNVVDAGVAGGIAMAVVQSDMVNFAGVAPIMIRTADTGEVVTITGLGHWPKAASADRFRQDHGGRIPDGYLSTVVPAAPDAWITALERFGTMGFGETAAAAIGFARDGFPMNALMSDILKDHADEHRRWPSTAAVYFPNGRAPETGEIFYQRDLARTLQYIVDEERGAASQSGRLRGLQAARDAFYRGDIAETMVRHYGENGGWLSRQDLAEFRVEIRPPVRVRLGNVEILSCGPWCQGPVLSQALAILKGFDLKALGHNSTAYIHTVVEAFKLAYADRHYYYGDPNFVDVSIDALVSDAYAGERRGLIDPRRASPGMPDPGNPQQLGTGSSVSRSAIRADRPPAREALDTSYICVVDARGNAFSATPSDASYNGPIVPGLGIAPSSRGSQSWTDPNLPACLAPGKRPRLTPSPAIAVGADGWCMPFGSPGNDLQPQSMGQVLLNTLVFRMTLQDAVDAPRFGTFSFPRSSDPHLYTPGQLKVESSIAESVRAELTALGHRVEAWPGHWWEAGSVCAALADVATGVVECAGDSRRPTGAIVR
ncbi:MAG: gamma-glutamyltransferase family protein [Alphaproteobacteria bacterium]|nr:gamma-glutamyltransferase family protein [Alphaproteobacteria bacterium]